MDIVEELAKEEIDKRRKVLLRCEIPSQRTLPEALQTLTKTEMDDIRYNLCVQGISALKKQDMVVALVPEIIKFAEKWFTTIGVEQYQFLEKISGSEGALCKDIDEQEIRLDYMRSMGIVFCGGEEEQLAWYMPEEILETYAALDRDKFYEAVQTNEEAVRLASGLLYYYGYLPYDQLYEKTSSYLKQDMPFIDFMGVLVNAGCWQGNIVNVETGAQYYSVLNYEALSDEQGRRNDLDFAPLSYEQVYQAGELGFIDDTEEYKALAAFFMTECGVQVEKAVDIVGELQIILRNDEKFSEMLEYIQSAVEIPSQEAAEKMTELLTQYNNASRLWALKGYSPNELRADSETPVAPYAVQKAPNNVVRFVPRSSLVGRNDLCPCGSGKKYKKCCLNKEI